MQTVRSRPFQRNELSYVTNQQRAYFGIFRGVNTSTRTGASRAQTLTLANFSNVLCRGDDVGKVDVVFDELKIICEWDGGYYHTEEKIDADIKQTNRILDDPEYVDYVVVRMRAGAPRIPELDAHSRCIMVYMPTNVAMKAALQQFAAHVQLIVPEVYGARLTSARNNEKLVNEMVQTLYSKCNVLSSSGSGR
tara:strand:+ start:1027 stop:1605 length:579 start_codon:yes stop_codon:yes gene_type:complete